MFVACNAPQDIFIQDILKIVCNASHILEQEYAVYCAGNTDFQVQHKDDLSPVTQADLKSNAYIMEQLKKFSPETPVLSEEEDAYLRHTWSKCWLLDPLDGTKEFLKQRPEFTINLSLIENGETIFSVIAVPAQGLVYLGYTEQLPYKYIQSEQQWLQYQHDNAAESNELKLGLSHRSRQPEYLAFVENLAKTQEITRITAGSAYKFCLMLEGKIDLYPRFHPTCEWDTSAGQGLLNSIGGGLVGLDAKPFRYNVRGTLLNSGFLAYRTISSKTIGLTALDALRK